MRLCGEHYSTGDIQPTYSLTRAPKLKTHASAPAHFALHHHRRRPTNVRIVVMHSLSHICLHITYYSICWLWCITNTFCRTKVCIKKHIVVYAVYAKNTTLATRVLRLHQNECASEFICSSVVVCVGTTNTTPPPHPSGQAKRVPYARAHCTYVQRVPRNTRLV